MLQIDGLDSERAKWSGAARAYLRMAERIAPAAATIAVTDSRAVADAYEARYGRRIPWIPYGAEVPDPGDAGWCRRLGVEPGRFTLFVGRLVPENNAHLLVEAQRLLAPDWPLVVVGDAPYADDYIAGLRAAAGPDVILPGYVFGEGYASSCTAAASCARPTEVGGTHPVIVEGMAAGAALLVSDHAPNLEVVGDAAAQLRPGGRGARAGRGPRRADRRSGAPPGPGRARRPARGRALLLGRLRRLLPAPVRARHRRGRSRRRGQAG